MNDQFTHGRLTHAISQVTVNLTYKESFMTTTTTATLAQVVLSDTIGNLHGWAYMAELFNYQGGTPQGQLVYVGDSITV